MSYERGATGLNISEQPVSLYTNWLNANGVLDSTALVGVNRREWMRDSHRGGRCAQKDRECGTS
jgi:hypothetical protein